MYFYNDCCCDMTRLGSIKQKILGLKNEVCTLISSFKEEVQQKFETRNNTVNTMEKNIKIVMSDQISESIIKLKDSVIEALKEDNLKMQKILKLWKSNSQKTNCI